MSSFSFLPVRILCFFTASLVSLSFFLSHSYVSRGSSSSSRTVRRRKENRGVADELRKASFQRTSSSEIIQPPEVLFRSAARGPEAKSRFWGERSEFGEGRLTIEARTCAGECIFTRARCLGLKGSFLRIVSLLIRAMRISCNQKDIFFG